MAAIPGTSVPKLSPLARLMRYSDFMLAALLIMIVAMLIVPLPEFFLDTMLVINITAACTIMIVALYNTEPLQFSVFPSLLLVTTLFRLALNVAATKLILGQGHAGQVIEAFGNFVIGGSYIVGIIAFLILIVVNFVVITNGAGRVAEVAARFTLDAMPGKQMSIDADMNAGLITEAQAKERRRVIERHADFYGAMDGASKFVRGDAIAAVLIIIINIVGGFALGLSRGGDIMGVLQQYTRLTIGEGLVSQIPALLISTATGLMVTRAASDSPMGQDFFGQIFSHAKPLVVVTGLLVILLFLPGFPKLQIFVLAGGIGGLAYSLTRNEQKKERDELRAEAQSKVGEHVPRGPENVMPLLTVETIELELGSNLVPLALPEEGGDLAERVGGVRRQIVLELGIILPTVRIRDNLQLRSNSYQIKIKGVPVASHDLYPDRVLAMDSGIAFQRFEGIETTEPAFGTPAQWLPKALKERAEMSGYIVADASSVLITHLAEIIKTHAHELLTRQETQKLIDHIKQHDEAAVNELIPNLLTLGEVQKVLQSLLKERVGIRDLTTLLETMADFAPRTKDLDQLAEFARASISRQICKQFQDDNGTIPVLTLASGLEQMFREAVQPTPTGNMLAVEPKLAQEMIRALTAQVEQAGEQGHSPVLLCSGAVRLPLKRLIERSLPALSVMAYTEIAPNIEVQSVGNVDVEPQLQPA